MIPAHKQKLVYLIWQDAHSIGGWHKEYEVDEIISSQACMIEQVGWVVYEDKYEIHMVSRRGSWTKPMTSMTDFGQYQRIPTTWVLKRQVLRIGR